MNTVLVSLIASVLTAGATLAGVALTMRNQRFATLSTLRMSAVEDRSGRLREALAKEITLTYEISFGYKNAMRNNLPWPGDKWDQVTSEDRLYNEILLLLDETRPVHKLLRNEIDELRDTDSDKLWTGRRDSVVAAANKAYADDIARALGQRTEPAAQATVPPQHAP